MTADSDKVTAYRAQSPKPGHPPSNDLMDMFPSIYSTRKRPRDTPQAAALSLESAPVLT